VTAIVPASGKQGTLVSITNLTGTGFKAGAKVYLTKTGSPSIAATNITVVAPDRIRCTFNISATTPIGLRNVQVTNADGQFGVKTGAFMVKTPSPPTVTGIVPASGFRGTTVQIANLSGTGFVLVPKPAVQLVKNTTTINATNITVTTPDRMTCTFTIPVNATTGSWTVRVKNADGQNGTKTNAFTIRAPPTVTAIVPDNGIQGSTVQITNLSGTDFMAGAKVNLTKAGTSDIAATNVTVISPKLIRCSFNIPAFAPIGLRNVTVTNADQQSGAKAGAFMVKTPLPPNS
jgi:hypothetical protein